MDIFLTRELVFAGLAFLVGGIRYGRYLWCIFKREARPHVFSYFNWGVMVAIGTAAQFQAGGGASAWVLLFVAAFCFLIAFLALFYGEKNITRSDWMAFIGALVTVPIWLVSKEPMLTFCLLILIDVLSYWPTWRKMWPDPWSEPTDGFFWAGLRYFFALLAVPDFTVAMMLYPFWLMLSDWGTGVYMVLRRRALSQPQIAKL